MADAMKILVVDDEQAICTSLKEILEEEGYTAFIAYTASEAQQLFNEGVDLVLLDIKLGNDENGIDMLKKFKAQKPHIPIIMISGHGTVALTAKAFKLGAHEFMEKPLRLIQVRACVRNALESVSLKHKISEQEKAKFPAPVFASILMKNLYNQTRRLASLQEPVVICGPSGSGKELVARALHFDGVRRHGPFIVTNAASMPLNLAGDELFGHEKGAFTGAIARREGCLEQAGNGTLFLDEIADLDLQIQAKLLRVIETGQFTRLGGAEVISVNARIIAATHKDLDNLIKQNLFRHDLWYRLCAFILRVPSLEKRKEDIPLLSKYFLDKVCTEIGEAKSLSDNAVKFLQNLSFPGNVRELKHIITRAAVLSDQKIIDKKQLHLVIFPSPGAGVVSANGSVTDYSKLGFKTAREQFEKDYFRQVLQNNNNNITSTASAIGMAQSNLSRKLKELGIR